MGKTNAKDVYTCKGCNGTFYLKDTIMFENDFFKMDDCVMHDITNIHFTGFCGICVSKSELPEAVGFLERRDKALKEELERIKRARDNGL